MGVDVVDLAAVLGQGHLHAAHCAFAGGLDHVVAIGGGAIAGELAQDVGTPGLGVLVLFQHQHAAAAGDDEAVTVGVVGAAGQFRGLVVARGHGTHAVEEHAHLPRDFFAATGKDNVLLAQLDEFGSVADAVGAGGTGRADGVVDALDLEGRGQAGRDGGAHALGDAVGAHALDATGPQHVGQLHLRRRRGATAAGDDAGAQVGDLFGGEPGLGNGLLQGDVGVGGCRSHEAQDLAIDVLLGIKGNVAGNLGAQPHVPIDGVEGDARLQRTQRCQDLLAVVAQTGDDAYTGDDDSFHVLAPGCLRDRRWAGFLGTEVRSRPCW